MVGKPQWQAVPARAARGNSWAGEQNKCHRSPSAAQTSSSPDIGDYPSCPGGFTLSWFRVACLSDPLPEIRLQERLDICNQEGQRRTRRLHISRQQKETHRLCPPSLSAGSTVRSKTSQKSTMWALNIWILCFPLAITIATPHTALVPNWGLEVT